MAAELPFHCGMAGPRVAAEAFEGRSACVSDERDGSGVTMAADHRAFNDSLVTASLSPAAGSRRVCFATIG